MKGCGIWTSFYRSNPHRFLMDYFGMTWLKPFQQVLICLMFKFTYFMTIASRGMGKSQLVAAALCAMCTLFPGIKVCIAAGVRSQSVNVLNKIIEDFLPKSNNLRNEISKWSTTSQDSSIHWRNGSTIKVVTAGDSARSARAHVVVGDEFVQIKKTILDKVIRKFKAGQRTPDFYNKPEYKNYPKEPNKEIYISSAYYKHHYSWGKFKAFFKSMIKGESYVVCGFPYQLPVANGYYPIEQIREEMQEDDFDEIAWSMEMDSLFFGASENAFFSFDHLDAARKIKNAIYPKPYYDLLGECKLKYQTKLSGEIRIMAMDIATQGGAKNDATCFAVLQMIPVGDGQFLRNLIYMETLDGGHTLDQAIRCRQLYDDLDIDYICVDTNGVGIAVYDNLVVDIVDPDRNNIVYHAFTCINDDKMAERCKYPDAPALIYSIKGTQSFNSECATLLRDHIRRGKLKLLSPESEANDKLHRLKQFKNLDMEDQLLFQMPYEQVTALIIEMVNLDYEVVNGGKIKVKEASGMRKDRYSACSYANYICSEIERDLRNYESEYEFDFDDN